MRNNLFREAFARYRKSKSVCNILHDKEWSQCVCANCVMTDLAEISSAVKKNRPSGITRTGLKEVIRHTASVAKGWCQDKSG